MAELKRGDLVDVVIKGVRVHEQDTDGCVTVLAEARDGGPGNWPMPPQAVIERVASTEWPPRPGDVWHGRSEMHPRRPIVFLCRLDREVDGDRGDELQLVPAVGDLSYVNTRADQVLKDFSPLTLVHREDEQDRPCSCDFHGDHLGCYPACSCGGPDLTGTAERGRTS